MVESCFELKGQALSFLRNIFRVLAITKWNAQFRLNRVPVFLKQGIVSLLPTFRNVGGTYEPLFV